MWEWVKVYADKLLNINLNIKFIDQMLEVMVGKEENAGYHLCLHFPQCIQKATSPGSFNPLPNDKFKTLPK